jgi:TolA-binding protein
MKRLFLIATLLVTVALVCTVAEAQDPPKPQQRPRPTQQQPKVTLEEKTEPEIVQETNEQILRRALDNLSDQVGKLTLEVQRMRQETERNSTMMELLLNEERLTKIEDKMDDAINNKAQLDNQEADIQRRTRNIQQELVLRAGPVLRRDEAEAALRLDFQRALENIRSQQTANQTRIADLQAQADRLKAKIEALRKKAERLETRVEEKD